MTSLAHDRFCTEIERQTSRLLTACDGAALDTRVPACPEWSLRDLLVHVGGAHRWSETLVRTRAKEDVPEKDVPDIEPTGDTAGALGAWLADGAARLATTLREAGPDAPVWSWAPWAQHAGFWARRMAHETLVHRADAAIATGQPYPVDPDLAADTVDEWLEIVGSPAAAGHDPEIAELRDGPARSIHLHATDTPAGLGAEWLIRFGGQDLSWQRVHGRADTALRGPLTDLLLVFQRRLSPDSDRVELLGDRETLDFWLERAKFA
ncbi:maleylpyruvate isomerase family mycothiol-dependent enzyme [Streptomyces lycii]|uniref:Maleylpyruvate isomerase family mycothiol-dependent enzyme n=2 Tax=Streptomyces TaxID=1883 RepID=A0ABQ7FGB7_9ACTN|nr:maleylpyruvate isomerase family mycothiol-dependent enzyme [Streptomyces lycii]KAF4406699.1 maleylpyruvate isomerase family mycothiol-dependent enzyme [Streptomyces lycii]